MPAQFPHEYPGAPGHNSKNPGGSYTSDCAYGCKCWAGPTRSGGPMGLDPWGECPNHPDRDKPQTVTKEFPLSDEQVNHALLTDPYAHALANLLDDIELRYGKVPNGHLAAALVQSLKHPLATEVPTDSMLARDIADDDIEWLRRRGGGSSG